MIKKIRLSPVSGIGAAALAVAAFSPMDKTEKPNIVLILADDMGWKDLGLRQETGDRFFCPPGLSDNSFLFFRS